MLQNNELLINKMDEMRNKIEIYEATQKGKKERGKKSYTGYLRTLAVLEALETFVYDNDIEYIAPSSANLGVLVETIITSYIKNKPQELAKARTSDLTTGGKRFDIKLLIKGSSSLPSVINENTKDDILIIGNMGVHILRNENIKEAIELGYFKKEKHGYKLRTTVFDSQLLVQTDFTKKLEKETGVLSYDGR